MVRLIVLALYFQVKAISREKQEDDVKGQEESNSRHATRHQVSVFAMIGILSSTFIRNHMSGI